MRVDACDVVARLATPETGAACDDMGTAQQARATAKAVNARCFIYCSIEAVNDGPTSKQPLCLMVRKRSKRSLAKLLVSSPLPAVVIEVPLRPSSSPVTLGGVDGLFSR